MDIKLSILVCSTQNRYKSFLPKILEELFAQAVGLPQVEVLALVDNKTRTLGDKRTDLVQLAQGEYVVFVDDDDRVHEQYISHLLSSTYFNPDIITFQAAVSMNGGEPKTCIYSKDIEADFNTPECYYRLPNHICCVRRDLALQVPFLPVLYGEDSDYSRRLKPLLKSEVYIDKVLYYYDYNVKTTETQSPIIRNKAREDLRRLLNNRNND